MSTNTILTPQVIANELLRRFKNNLAFASAVRHEYDDRFAQNGGKIGDTLNLRVPVKFTTGSSATITPQDIVEKTIPLVINTQRNTSFSIPSKSLTLDIDRFGERYLDSAAVALANAVDVDGLTVAYRAIANFVGDIGTTPTALKTYLQAGAWLDKMGCPFDSKRSVCIAPDMQVEIVNTLSTLFNSQIQIKSQYEKGRMGTALGFDWMVDQNVRSHTCGQLGGTPAVSADAAQTGASIATVGWTAAAANRLKAGDVITFAGVYAVNPVSGDTLADLKRFVVTADTASLGDGTVALPIYPSIIVTGPYKTCSGSPGAGALISVFDHVQADQATHVASKISPQGIAFHREAFALAMVPLEMPRDVHFSARATDKETGMSVRIWSASDIINDAFITRCDILYGWAVPIPEFACRIAG